MSRDVAGGREETRSDRRHVSTFDSFHLCTENRQHFKPLTFIVSSVIISERTCSNDSEKKQYYLECGTPGSATLDLKYQRVRTRQSACMPRAKKA